MSLVGQWLFDWQTLIAGVLALGAAYWAGRIVNRQINQAEKFRLEDLEQRHAAARSILPLALSSIGELTVAVGERVSLAIDEIDDPEFDVAFDHFEAGRHEQLDFPRIAISDEVISAIRQFVETLKDQGNVRHVAELMSSLQILIARYNSFNFRQAAPVEGLYGLLLDAGKVRMLANAMFNYGRFVDEGQFTVVGAASDEVAWSLINKEALGLVFFRPRLDRYAETLNAKIESYKAASISPWNEKFEY